MAAQSTGTMKYLSTLKLKKRRTKTVQTIKLFVMLARIVALHSLNYVEGQTILTEKKLTKMEAG